MTTQKMREGSKWTQHATPNWTKLEVNFTGNRAASRTDYIPEMCGLRSDRVRENLNVDVMSHTDGWIDNYLYREVKSKYLKE